MTRWFTTVETFWRLRLALFDHVTMNIARSSTIEIGIAENSFTANA